MILARYKQRVLVIREEVKLFLPCVKLPSPFSCIWAQTIPSLSTSISSSGDEAVHTFSCHRAHSWAVSIIHLYTTADSNRVKPLEGRSADQDSDFNYLVKHGFGSLSLCCASSRCLIPISSWELQINQSSTSHQREIGSIWDWPTQ